MRIAVGVMAAITLFSTGWAASSTMGLFDARSIDKEGTQKAHELETRLTVLEKTLEPRLQAIQTSLSAIQVSVAATQSKLDGHIFREKTQ